jgi:hypothetical protein
MDYMRKLLFWQFLYPLRANQVSWLKKYMCGVYFFSTYSMKLPVHKISICFTICRSICEQLSYGCPCSICIKFCADDADVSICCASQASGLLGGIPNLPPVSSIFSFACIFDVFSYCLQVDLLLETFSHNQLFCQLHWCGRKISS